MHFLSRFFFSFFFLFFFNISFAERDVGYKLPPPIYRFGVAWREN